MIGWIGSGLLILGIILVGRKNKWGWISEFLGEIFWMKQAISTNQLSLLVVCIVFGVIQIHNFWLWNKKTGE